MNVKQDHTKHTPICFQKDNAGWFYYLYLFNFYDYLKVTVELLNKSH